MLMSAQQQTTACAAWSVPLVNGCERRGRRTPLLSEKDSRSGTEGQQYWTKVTDVEDAGGTGAAGTLQEERNRAENDRVQLILFGKIVCHQPVCKFVCICITHTHTHTHAYTRTHTFVFSKFMCMYIISTIHMQKTATPNVVSDPRTLQLIVNKNSKKFQSVLLPSIYIP